MRAALVQGSLIEERVSGTLLHISVLVKPTNIDQVLSVYSAPSQHLHTLLIHV